MNDLSNWKTRDLSVALERIAPLELAESFDNVGLLVGDPAARVSRVLVAIDVTEEVLREALDGAFEAIVAYHPPIFAPLKRLVEPTLAYRIARAGLSVYSPHTALDCAIGGTNDALADLVGMRARRAVVPKRLRAAGASSAVNEERLKLVTFVPDGALEAVSDALFTAGAGRIGAYRECSFRTAGTGTFFGEESAHPVVGERGRRETVAETRLEVALPSSLVGAAVAALRKAHPYEEAAFDLVRLAPEPLPLGAEPATDDASPLGMGRIGAVDDTTAGALAAHVRAQLGLAGVLLAGAADKPVKTVAVLAGSAGDLVKTALDRGADVVVTGEMRHHDALAVVARGAAVICTLHSNSERLALPALAERIRHELPGLIVDVSRHDHDPFHFLAR